VFIGIIKTRKFPSNTTILLYIIDWLHVSPLWGQHQAFTRNSFVKKAVYILGITNKFFNFVFPCITV